MIRKRETNLAIHPALVPDFGGLDKKPRPLDGDVITIGRARGCDIGLDAPDISTLHCLIYRTPEGFRVRDCGSRSGTRINGHEPRNNVLAEGDILQIGPFAFTVRIPASQRNAARQPDAKKLERGERSRRKLGQLAWRFRGRLRKVLAESGGSQAELVRNVAELKKRLKAYDQRVNQLEAAERDLEAERADLGKQRGGLQARAQQVERDVAKRLEKADQEIHVKWQEFQQRCAREEQQRQQNIVQWQREREETMIMKEQCVAEQAAAKSFLEQQRATLAEAEAALREQRVELGQMMGDLRELQASIKKQQGADVEGLTRENDDLRRLLGEYEQRLTEVVDNRPADMSKDVASLKGENELLRQLLEGKDGVVEELTQQVTQLKHQVEELQDRPAAPQATPAPSANIDLESYEAELNQYRQQLEADRARLNKEIEQVRHRNAELDEATREMEMEMSKERAEFARERIRLDRMRDEVRAELERVQRDAGMRDSLAGVQKLREEMTQKKAPATKEDGNTRLNDRLRTFRNRLTDTPS